MSDTAPDANVQVSHEVNGRTLSGMGASPEQLEAVMERHAPEPAPEAKGTAVTPTTDGKPVEAAPALEAKPESRGRQRFSELAKERDAAKADAEAAKAEREALAKERDELKARIEQPPREPAKPAEPAAAKEFDFPDYETYLQTHPDASWDAWRRKEMAAFAEFRDQQSDLDARISRALDIDRETRTLHETVARTRAKGRDAYADFDTVLASGAGAGVNLGPTPEQAVRRCTTIFQHPQSEHLQYAIMKDGALAARLGAMDDIAFGMALAALVPSSTVRSTATRKTEPPPAPYQPVNGNSATTATASGELAGKSFDFDKSGYREKRAAERKASRR